PEAGWPEPEPAPEDLARRLAAPAVPAAAQPEIPVHLPGHGADRAGPGRGRVPVAGLSAALAGPGAWRPHPSGLLLRHPARRAAGDVRRPGPALRHGRGLPAAAEGTHAALPARH